MATASTSLGYIRPTAHQVSEGLRGFLMAIAIYIATKTKIPRAEFYKLHIVDHDSVRDHVTSHCLCSLIEMQIMVPAKLYPLIWAVTKFSYVIVAMLIFGGGMSFILMPKKMVKTNKQWKSIRLSKDNPLRMVAQRKRKKPFMGFSTYYNWACLGYSTKELPCNFWNSHMRQHTFWLVSFSRWCCILVGISNETMAMQLSKLGYVAAYFLACPYYENMNSTQHGLTFILYFGFLLEALIVVFGVQIVGLLAELVGYIGNWVKSWLNVKLIMEIDL